MLKKLLKTICPATRLTPLMGLALMYGCGKEISEPQNSGPGGSSDYSQILPSALTVQIVESESAKSFYTVPRDGIFELPQQLVVSQGNGAFKKIKISYNMELDGIYEFHCIYTSTGQTDVIPLVRCEDPVGGSFGDITGQVFPMDQSKQIEMKLTNPSSNDLIIDANFEVRWL